MNEEVGAVGMDRLNSISVMKKSLFLILICVIFPLTAVLPHAQATGGSSYFGSKGGKHFKDKGFPCPPKKFFQKNGHSAHSHIEWYIEKSFGKQLCKSNHPPVADAGPDQNAEIGAKVILDGSGSTDKDGDRLSFKWEIIESPEGSAAELDDSISVMPSFFANVAGTYVIELTVQEVKKEKGKKRHKRKYKRKNTREGKSDTDIVNIFVDGNTPPVANAGEDQMVEVDGIVKLDGSGSSDVDGDELTFRWRLKSVPPGSGAILDDLEAVMPTFKADKEGEYIAELIVNDGLVDSQADEVVINTKQEENLPPVALPRVKEPMEQPVEVGATVVLDGSDSFDPNDDPITYAWTITSQPQNSTAQLDDSTDVMPSFVADLPGDFVIQLIVTDDKGAPSEPVTVMVSTRNRRPVANAGPDQTMPFNEEGNEEVRLDGSQSSDPDGDEITYNWTFTDKPENSNSELDDSTAMMPTFIPDLPGTYILQLIVNDGELDSEPSEDPNPTVVIQVREGERLVCGDLLSGSIDAEGEIDQFFFFGQAGDVVDVVLVHFGITGSARATVIAPSGVEVLDFAAQNQREIILPGKREL